MIIGLVIDVQRLSFADNCSTSRKRQPMEKALERRVKHTFNQAKDLRIEKGIDQDRYMRERLPDLG
jgi:hypothetical protein